MQSLKKRIQAAQQLLTPYAVPHEGMLGRTRFEEPDATRFPFQRDRDRIIHSKAFRRLKGKTQVFVAGESSEGDHVRTRLTHTMEVAQISRDMARTLGLNEDLAECIALAHDLGHPPFGHAGEEALNTWMQTHGQRFEHNEQSLRIVTVLDPLNLNTEVLEGLMKHRTPHDHPATPLSRNPSLEAQVVNIADEIAYTGHDIDDGLRAQMFTQEQATSLPLIADIRGRSIRSGLIDALVMDVYAESQRRFTGHGIHTLDDVYCCSSPLICFSSDVLKSTKSIRTFLWDHLYMHPAVKQKAEEGKHIVMQLADAYIAHPPEKVRSLMQEHESHVTEAVKDYVCGMTDSFAMQSCNAEILK